MYPSNIDFVCLSLSEAHERRQAATEVFQSIGIQPIWWIVDRHPVDGICGCFESHYQIWTSPELTKEFTLIFEDDIQLSEEFNLQYFKDVLHRLKYILPEEGDLLKFDSAHIHIQDRRILEFPQSNLHITMSRGNYFGTLAYAIHRPSFQKVAKQVRPYLGIAVDVALTLEVNCLTLEPPLFYQDYTTSYISSGGAHRYLINTLKLNSLLLLINRIPYIRRLSLTYAADNGSLRNVECIDRRVGE